MKQLLCVLQPISLQAGLVAQWYRCGWAQLAPSCLCSPVLEPRFCSGQSYAQFLGQALPGLPVWICTHVVCHLQDSQLGFREPGPLPPEWWSTCTGINNQPLRGEHYSGTNLAFVLRWEVKVLWKKMQLKLPYYYYSASNYRGLLARCLHILLDTPRPSPAPQINAR